MARGDPPFVGGERELLEGWLAFQRETLAMKCDGLDAEQLSERPLPPSALSLHGLVRHMTQLEHADGGVLRGSGAELLYESADFNEIAGDPVAAIATWRDECSAFSEALATYESLDDPVRTPGFAALRARGVLLHLVMEYARHNGHADLLREHLDGTTGY